jgi:hypothetical protein
MSSTSLPTGKKRNSGQDSVVQTPSTKSHLKGVTSKLKEFKSFSKFSKKETPVDNYPSSSLHQDDLVHKENENAGESVTTSTEAHKNSGSGASNAVIHEGKPEPLISAVIVRPRNTTTEASGTSMDVAVEIAQPTVSIVESTKNIKEEKPVVRPVAGLWEEAFDTLKGDDKALVEDYEKALKRDKTLSAIVGSTSFLTGAEVPTQIQMKDAIQRKIDDIESKEVET